MCEIASFGRRLHWCISSEKFMTKKREGTKMAGHASLVLGCIALLVCGSWSENVEVAGTCNPSWTPLPGSLIHFTTSMNYLWGVNRANDIFICNVPCTGHWRHIPGKLKQIDADDSEVWGVNANDDIFKRAVDGSGRWTHVRGKLKHVSASGNGYIWGVNRRDYIYMCKKPCSGAWKHIPGRLSQIDGGNQFVYGVSHNQYTHIRPVDGSGAWKSQKTNNKGRYVTATGDNKVYRLGLNYKVYHCDAPCFDGRWIKLSDDTLTQIDGSVHMLVGRNTAEQLYYKKI